MEWDLNITGFGIANYRSFLGAGSFVYDFGKVNVFIGKNNSGKSNILRFLQDVSVGPVGYGNNPVKSELDRNRKATEPIHLGVGVNLCPKNQQPNSVAWSYFLVDPKKPAAKTLELWMEYSSGQACGENPFEAFNDDWLLKLHKQLSSSYYTSAPPRQQLLNETLNAAVRFIKPRFHDLFKKLIYVPAIREIRTVEGDVSKGIIDLSGGNLVKRLRQMQHPAVGKESDQELFHRIEKLVQDLLGEKEIKLEIPADVHDIYMRISGVRLPLHHYGTGIHELVILCSALLMHEDHIVCIEEPEIHLHPELLRKFVKFLGTTKNTYFIATHSNVLLDADETTAIYHVRHDGNSTFIDRSQTNNHTREILRDLSYRASDLLQTNGIIWVEGPSDRLYINRWLQLSGSQFIEGIHYSIMFYGGACLANLSAADCDLADDFVELLRINSNVIVVIDRDGDSPDTTLRAYKTRIRDEVGLDKCWITSGREVENYLPSSLMDRYLLSIYTGKVSAIQFGRDDKISDCIKAAVNGRSFTYNDDKRGNAKKICDAMTSDDIDVFDLKQRMTQILNSISAWNGGSVTK